MARFPVSEGDIIVLAQNIIAGLDDNAAIYPAPPVGTVALKAVLASFTTLQTNAAAAKAAAEAATTLKAAGLEELIDLPAAPVGFESTWDKFSAAQAGAMKADLRYADLPALSACVTVVETRHIDGDAQAGARETGGVRRTMMHMLAAQAGNTVNFDDDKLKLLGWAGRRAAAALAAPGQPRTLEAPRQGDGWVFLDLPACLRAGLLTPSNERQIGTHRQAPRQNPRGMMPCIMCTS